jgi:DeoR/GlpR family transcriptional regulator of sugar metabolism
MLKEKRHALIIENLMKQEVMQVVDLARLLKVSTVTIRKDLAELEKKNKLYRSHGKAKLVNPYITNRTISEKEKLATKEKISIGQYAASLITKNDSIIIASGTTVLAFSKCIVPTSHLTVVTASLNVSEVLSDNECINIIQLGGVMRHSSRSVVGKYAEAPLAEFSCSKLYLGVDGIDLDYGITTTDYREAELNKAMIRTAEKTIVLADSSKFNRRGFSKIANMDDVDLIITDSNIPSKIAQRIEQMGIELKIVPITENIFE